MGFFDKMGETISSKSKDVAKKAKEMAEVTGLNGQIGTQKDVIYKVRKEIGDLVCDNRETWKELNLDDQFARLDAATAEIERLQGEIRRVKGIKLCESCGAEIEREAAFCPKCGAAAPVVEEETVEAENTEEASVPELTAQEVPSEEVTTEEVVSADAAPTDEVPAE